MDCQKLTEKFEKELQQVLNNLGKRKHVKKDYIKIYNHVLPQNHSLSNKIDPEAEGGNKTPKQGTIRCQAPYTGGKIKVNPGWLG